jgi:hypothetical protein
MAKYFGIHSFTNPEPELRVWIACLGGRDTSRGAVDYNQEQGEIFLQPNPSGLDNTPEQIVVDFIRAAVTRTAM